MKKSYIYFVLILSNLFAQSFTGYIKDVSGEPVSFVIIEEINSNLEEKNWTISDENGVFTINVQSNSQLSFDRIGYKDNVIELSKIELNSIFMFNNNYLCVSNFRTTTKTENEQRPISGYRFCLLYTSPSPRD